MTILDELLNELDTPEKMDRLGLMLRKQARNMRESFQVRDGELYETRIGVMLVLRSCTRTKHGNVHDWVWLDHMGSIVGGLVSTNAEAMIMDMKSRPGEFCNYIGHLSDYLKPGFWKNDKKPLIRIDVE